MNTHSLLLLLVAAAGVLLVLVAAHEVLPPFPSASSGIVSHQSASNAGSRIHFA